MRHFHPKEDGCQPGPASDRQLRRCTCSSAARGRRGAAPPNPCRPAPRPEGAAVCARRPACGARSDRLPGRAARRPPRPGAPVSRTCSFWAISAPARPERGGASFPGGVCPEHLTPESSCAGPSAFSGHPACGVRHPRFRTPSACPFPTVRLHTDPAAVPAGTWPCPLRARSARGPGAAAAAAHAPDPSRLAPPPESHSCPVALRHLTSRQVSG